MGRPREVTANISALKAWRKEKGWSQKELAARAMAQGEDVTVSPTLIALIETGERQPSLRNAAAIAAAFGVAVEVIAEIHEDTKEPAA